MTPDQIERLAAVGNALRPDWAFASLRTFIATKLAHRAYGDTAVAIAYVATKTPTKTPRLLVESGPWWNASDEQGTHRPPKHDEACRVCGRWLESCVCGEHASRPAQAATNPAEHIARIRANLRGTEK